MSKKILVGNSEHEFIKKAVKQLRSWNYQVVIAEDADQAVHCAHHEKPDLILLDVQMPAGGAEAVHRHLGLSVDTEFIPVILFSDLPEKDVRKLAQKYEAVDYITKPYDPNILHAKIQKIFGDCENYDL